MKKLNYLIILLLACRICNAQNLVPNPSFEDTIACPTQTGDVEKAQYWSKYQNSPDYFNACSTTPYIGVPTNTWFGYQFPHTGNAYMGAFCYNTGSGLYREIIGAPLTQSMTIGTKYFLSVYISKAEMHCWASDHFGFRFSTVQYSTFTNPAPLGFAHYFSTAIVTDTIGWTKISGSFIADSSYSYIMLGNFFNNTITNTIQIGTLGFQSYYYIDDVCVSSDSLTCNSSVGINEVMNQEELVLFPNPFTDKINITAKRNEPIEVNLYDVTSRKIFHQSFTNSITINTEQLAKGIYIYELRNKNGVIKKGKIVKD
jgi:hypothetical protein